MVGFSDNLSIQWRSIQQHRIRGTGPVTLETAKRRCVFFSLNNHRLSINYDVRFFSTLTTLQKFKYGNALC